MVRFLASAFGPVQLSTHTNGPIDRALYKSRSEIWDDLNSQADRILVGNAGKALTREEIRAALWKSNDLYTGSRTIDVHVQHLRKKIEDDPSDPKLILTVQGTGYILDSQIKNRSESAIRSVGIQNSR